MSINTRSTSKKGFTHFELVLLVIVVAIIASAGIYILNYNKNKSKATSLTKVSEANLLFSMPATNVNGVPTKVDFYGCKKAQNGSIVSKGTKLWYGVVAFPGVLNAPKSPNVNIFTDVGSDADSKSLIYDLQYSRRGTLFVTFPYYWIMGVENQFNIAIKDTAGNKIFTGTANLADITMDCPVWANDSLNNRNNHDTAPDKTQPNKPSNSTSSNSGAGLTSTTTKQTKISAYPYAFGNFTRVHHLYKKNVANPKASNYDIFWSDSKKQVLIIQYRVNIFAGSGLKPGLFYSNIYNGAPSAATRIASFAVTDPISKGESNSPLQTGSTEEITSVKNKMKTAEAVNGRYWGEVHITKAQMKGKNILYFAVGYDPQRKEKQPDYSYVQAVDVDKVGWYNKTTGQQPRIRK